MAAQQLAQNLNGMCLNLLTRISKLVDKNVKNNLFDLWLFSHELHEDI